MRLLVVLALGLLASTGRLPADGSPSFLTIAQGNLNGRAADEASASISADGRFVAFLSYAPLAAADTNSHADIYVLDRATGSVSLETPEYAGSPFDHTVTTPQLSGDGQRLVYVVSPPPEHGRTPPPRTIMFRDRSIGVTRALLAGGAPPNGDSRDPRITADGRTVVFASSSTNLTDAPDANQAVEDVFAADVMTMAVRRLSVDSSGRQMAAGSSFAPAVSHDGRYVVFSWAALDGLRGRADEGRARVDVYRRDTRLGVTIKISEAPEIGVANGSSYDAAISADGRFVAFVSDATNLTGRRDRNGAPDIYLRDTLAATTSLASHNAQGDAANGPSRRPVLSADGRVLVFQSDASDLTCRADCRAADRDINLVSDIFALDRVSGAMRRVSAGRTAWMEPSIGPVIDGSGTVIAFSSRRPRHARDDRDDYDLFVSPGGRGGFPR